MKVKQLKLLLENMDDECEVFIRNSVNPFGNIQDLEQIELSTYGFFGKDIPCLIMNTANSKELELDENDCVKTLINTQK